MWLLTAALLPPVPRRSLAAARAAALRAAATDGELSPPAEADPTAAFFEEGSPYELDLNVLQEVSRRMKASGRPPQQLTAALSSTGEPAFSAPELVPPKPPPGYDDEGEYDRLDARDFWHHRLYGVFPTAARRDAVLAFRERLQPVVRCSLALPLLLGWRRPAAAAALSLALAPWVHAALPGAHLALQAWRNARSRAAGRLPQVPPYPAAGAAAAQGAAAAAAAARGASSSWLPRARAPDVLCVGYLLAGSGLVAASALSRVANPLEPLGSAHTSETRASAASVTPRLLRRCATAGCLPPALNPTQPSPGRWLPRSCSA